MDSLDKMKLLSQISSENISKQIDTKNGIQTSASQVLTFTTIFITILFYVLDNKTGVSKQEIAIPLITSIIVVLLLVRTIVGYDFFIGVHEDKFPEIYDKSEFDLYEYIMNAKRSSVQYNADYILKMKFLFNLAVILLCFTLIYLLLLIF